MRAIAIPRHGPPDVLEDRTLEDRPLRPQDVRVRVAAAGVNFADLMGRVGLYPDAPRLPYVPGYEVAGVVVEAGERAAARLPPGTRVMATTRFGGYADLVRTPEHAVAGLAPHVDLHAAAATPVAYLTAWLALVRFGGVEAGARVLVHGGAGGVGLAAIEVARGLGAEVHATAGGTAKCEVLRARGVAAAFDHQAGGLEDAAREATRGRGYDVVLDPRGPEGFQESLRLLAPLGRLVCFGFSTLVAGPRRRLWHAATKVLGAAKFNPIVLMNQNAAVAGLNLARLFGEKDLQRDGLERLAAALAEGRIHPTIDRTFPLDAAGAAAAHQRLHDRLNVGKVLLVAEDAAP